MKILNQFNMRRKSQTQLNYVLTIITNTNSDFSAFSQYATYLRSIYLFRGFCVFSDIGKDSDRMLHIIW